MKVENVKLLGVLCVFLLGSASQRTYSTGMVYSAFGGMTKEQFGSNTPIYNKLCYNVRGQLAEIRESTSYTSSTDTFPFRTLAYMPCAVTFGQILLTWKLRTIAIIRIRSTG